MKKVSSTLNLKKLKIIYAIIFFNKFKKISKKKFTGKYN